MNFAGAQANPVRVLITNDGGAHPPQKWATITALDLVSITPDIDPARRDAAIGLRRKIAGALLERFAAVKASSSSAELDQMGTTALESIQALAAGTPWAESFAHPEIAAAMLHTIRRNLFSAADVTLKVE